MEQLGASSESFLEAVWGPVGESDWDAGQQNSFFVSLRQVLAGFLALGWSLGRLFGVFFGCRRCFFESALVVRGSIPRIL